MLNSYISDLRKKGYCHITFRINTIKKIIKEVINSILISFPVTRIFFSKCLQDFLYIAENSVDIYNTAPIISNITDLFIININPVSAILKKTEEPFGINKIVLT